MGSDGGGRPGAGPPVRPASVHRPKRSGRPERPGGGPIARVSVERPLWRALTAFRLFALVYAVLKFVHVRHDYVHPGAAWVYLAVLALWTCGTTAQVGSADRCTRWFLGADLTLSVTGILLTAALASRAAIDAGQNTLPLIWAAGSVLAFAIKGGWRWAAPASAVIGLADIAERGRVTQGVVHNIVLLFLISTGIGYVVEVARSSERALTRALRIEAATHERERLARDIHDSVLQVLAMVQRRGAEVGGEAAELGRLAGEQESALRSLMLGAPVPPQRAPESTDTGEGDGDEGDEGDLTALLAPRAGSRVTLSAPAGPVPLPPHAAAELAAAVGAALDNVDRHAGTGAHAWILVEDEGDAVVVTVRDDGPGIPPDRLAAAEREGRLGVAQSIRGRLRDLGGTVDVLCVPGQGAEVELRVPRTPRPAPDGPDSAPAPDSGGKPR